MRDFLCDFKLWLRTTQRSTVMRIGALEAGGTKMVCAVGNEKGEILDRMTIPTETPEITIPRLLNYFKEKEPRSARLSVVLVRWI